MKKEAWPDKLLACLAIVALRIIAWLPPKSYAICSRLLARLAWPLARSKCRIAELNLELCFPDWSAAERERVARLTLEENIRWLFTSARAWCRPRSLELEMQHSTIEGLQHIKRAQERGQITVLYQAHQTHMDIALYIFSRHFAICPTYRPYRTRIFNDFMRNSRLQMASAIVSIKEPRAIVRAAAQHQVLWITCDQDLGAKGAIFAPFLGVVAAHHQGVRRFSKLCKAQACCLTVERKDNLSYHLRIHPPLESFPSAGAERDIVEQNRPIEAALRARPEQFLWFHRRFKTQPNRMPSPYEQL